MPLDQDDISKIVELAAMGYTGKVIAERFSISEQYVSQILQKNADDLAEMRANPTRSRLGASRTEQEGRSRKKATRVQSPKTPTSKAILDAAAKEALAGATKPAPARRTTT